MLRRLLVDIVILSSAPSEPLWSMNTASVSFRMIMIAYGPPVLSLIIVAFHVD